MLGVDDKQAQTARARAPPECAPSPPLRVRPTRRARDVALRTIHRQYDDPFRVRRLGYNPFDDDDDVVARGMADSARERRRTLGSGDARWLSIGGGDDDSLSSSDGEYVENELENRQRAGSEDDDGAKDDNMDMGNRTPVMTRQDHVQALRVEAAVVDELPASLTAIVAPIPRSAEPLSFDFDHDWQPQNLGVTTVDRTVDGSVNTHPRDEEPLVRPSTPELASVRQRKIAETIRKLFGIRGISTVPDTANATRKRKRRTAAARSRRLRKVQMPGHGGGSLMVRGDNALSDAEVEARMRRKRVKRDRVVAEGARQPHALVVLSDDEEMTRKRRHGTARRALRVVSDDEHARRNSTIRRSAIPNSRQKTPSRHRAEATSAASFESPAVATTASRRPRKTATERRAEAQIKVDAFVDAFLQTNSEPFDTTVHERPDFLRLAERQFRSWRSGGNPTKALQQLRRKEIRIYDDIKDHVEQETRDRLLCTYYKDIKPVKRRRRKPAAITSAARQQKQAIPVDSEEEEEDEPYLETSHRIPDSPPIRRSRKPLEAIISTKRFRRKSVRRASSSKLHPPPSASRRHNGVPPLLPTTSRPLPSSDVFEADDDYQQMADFERETSATTAFDLLMSASRTHIATPRRRKEKQLRPKKRQSIVPASFTPGRHGDVPLSALPTFRAPWEQRFATSSTHAVLTSFATIHDIDAVGTFNPVPATLLPGLLPVVPSDKAYMDTSTVHANFQSLWQLCTCTVQFEHVEKQSAGNRVMFQQWRRLRLFIDQCCALVPSTLPDGVVEELAFVSAGMEALLTKGSVPSVPTTSSTLMKSPRSLGLRLALRLFDAILSRSSGDNSNDKFSALLADFLDVTLHLMVTYPLNEIPPDYQSLYCGHTTEELWRTMCELWVRVPSDATSGATDILAKTIASFVERESTTESSSTMQIVTTVLRTVQLLATLLPSADLDLWSIVSWCIDYATNKQRKPVSSTQAQQLLAFCVDFVMAFGKQRPMQDKGLKILANLGALDMSFKESSATADSKLTVVSGDVRIRPLVDFQLRTTDGRYVLSAFGEGHRLFDLVAFYFQEECGSVCTIRLSSSGASYVPPTDPAIARPQLSLFKKLTSQLLLAQLPSRPSALAIGSSTTDLHKLLQLLLLYTLAAPLQQKASFALYIDRILDFEKSTNAEARLYVLQAALFQIKVLLDFRETPTKMIESFFEKFQSVTGEYQLEELRRGQPVLFRNSDRVGTSGSTNGAAALGGFRSDLEYQQWHRAQAQRATCIERILLDMRVVIEGMGFQEDGFLLARSEWTSMINTTSKFPSRVRAAAVQLLHTFYGVWKRNNEIIAAMRDGKSRKQAIDEVYPLREELPLADGHTDLSFLPVRAAQHDSIHSRDEFDDEFDDALLAGVDLNLATTTSLPRRTLLSVDELNFITDIETKNNRFAEDMHPVMGFLSGLVQSRFKDTTGSGVDDALYLALIDAMVDAIVAYASRQRTSSDAAWQSMVNMHGPLAFWATASMQQYFRLDNRIRNLRFMNALLAFDADRTVRMFEELSMQVWFEAFVDQWLSAVGPFSAIFRETFDSYSRRLFACDVEVLRGIMFDEIAMKRGRETASLALLGDVLANLSGLYDRLKAQGPGKESAARKLVVNLPQLARVCEREHLAAKWSIHASAVKAQVQGKVDALLGMLIATCSNILYDKAEPRPLLVSIDQEFTRDVAGAAVEPSQLSSKLIRTVSRLDFTRDARLRSVLHHQLRVNFERVNLLTFSNAEVFWKNDTCLNFFAECCGGEDTPSRTFREYLLRLVLRRYFSLASQHHCWKMSTMSLARKVWSYDERRMVDGSATFAELWPAYESLLVDVVDMLEEWETYIIGSSSPASYCIMAALLVELSRRILAASSRVKASAIPQSAAQFISLIHARCFNLLFACTRCSASREMVTPNDKLMQLREDFAWEVEESHREQIFSGASDAKKDATVLPTYDDYCQEYGGNDHEGEAGSSTGANVTNATAEPMPATTTVGTADHWNKEVLRRLVAACFRFLADCHRLRADLRLDLDTLQCLQRVSPTHFQATFSASGGLGPAATLLRLRGDGPSDHVVI